MNKLLKNMLASRSEKVYGILLLLLLGLFTFAGVRGWKVINPHHAEHWNKEGSHYNNRYYHK